MRYAMSADWAFSIQNTIENVVREHFPSQLRQWPLLQAFNFEAYQVGNDHFVLVLRDKLSGISAGPGEFTPFPYTDHPPAPHSKAEIQRWFSYLINRFSLRDEDMAMVLPIHDSGQQSASADYEMFSDVEKELWNYQLSLWIAKQQSSLGISVQAPPDESSVAKTILEGKMFTRVPSLLALCPFLEHHNAPKTSVAHLLYELSLGHLVELRRKPYSGSSTSQNSSSPTLDE